MFGTATINIDGSSLGNALETMLTAKDIIPGDAPSYQLCKEIFLFHPIGGKMAEAPVAMAQSQAREISIPDSPEERVRDKFVEQWATDKCDEVIFNVATLARVYGIASIAVVTEGEQPDQPLDFKKLHKTTMSFSVFDPLNTAGSLVLNQDPNSIDFQKVTAIAVSGKAYHRSRTVTIMNGRPVYIAYTPSAFGFVGRSCFQRVLFPLKSFIQTMLTDDLVTKKAGVFIAMLKTAGAIIDNIMASIAVLKRFFVKVATTGNVISIGIDEKIDTLNMQNIDGAYGMARKNILENIAVGDDMPAKVLNAETFAEGFGEGTEDAKHLAGYVDSKRRWMAPLYQFMDAITQRRAWTPDFYKTIQKDFAEYASVDYEEALYRWSASFVAAWPSLLTEPDSEKVKTDDVKLKAIIATVEVFGPMLDPENKATLLDWAQQNINENKMMFQSPLFLDIEALKDYEPPAPMEEPAEPKPFAASDAANMRRMKRKFSNDELKEFLAIMEQDPEGLPVPRHPHLRIAARNDAVEPPAAEAVNIPVNVSKSTDRTEYMRNYMRDWRKRQREERDAGHA